MGGLQQERSNDVFVSCQLGISLLYQDINGNVEDDFNEQLIVNG